MKRGDFVKLLEAHGVYFDHQGKRHEIFKHRATGKIIPVPRHHQEIDNDFVKDVLKEIPRN
ncbi:hypothetical protein AGMMS49546_34430 [Spirochaetia bacterium]|nr:hypothetical protein AGMMS49546_34430 [Spirochaetia bacterium]